MEHEEEKVKIGFLLSRDFSLCFFQLIELPSASNLAARGRWTGW